MGRIKSEIETELVAVRMPITLIEQLDQAAAADERTRTFIVIKAVAAFLKPTKRATKQATK